MSEAEKSASWPIVVGLVVVALLLVGGSYFGSYAATASTFDFDETVDDVPVRIRWYRHDWMVALFTPAGYFESWLTCKDVRVLRNPVG